MNVVILVHVLDINVLNKKFLFVLNGQWTFNNENNKNEQNYRTIHSPFNANMQIFP